MKRLILITLAFLPLFVIGQRTEYETKTLWSMSGVTGDSTQVVSLKVSKAEGKLVEVEFASTNCNLLQLYVGYGLTPDKPRYPATVSGLTNPITLDKTTYTQTYLGVESNGISVDFSQYNANYMYFKLIDNALCTSGTIDLLYK